MPVLAMLELDGDTAALLAAGERIEARLGTPAGLGAPARRGPGGAARRRPPHDPGHRDALAASGLLGLVTASRSRAFEGVAFQRF